MDHTLLFFITLTLTMKRLRLILHFKFKLVPRTEQINVGYKTHHENVL